MPQPQDKKLQSGYDSNFTYWFRTLVDAAQFVANLIKNDVVVCFKADLSKFDIDKLFVDHMWISNFEDFNVPITFEYHGGISSNNIELMSRDEVLTQLNYEHTHESKIYSYAD